VRRSSQTRPAENVVGNLTKMRHNLHSDFVIICELQNSSKQTELPTKTITEYYESGKIKSVGAIDEVHINLITIEELERIYEKNENLKVFLMEL
jgi:hypothetical protein